MQPTATSCSTASSSSNALTRPHNQGEWRGAKEAFRLIQPGGDHFIKGAHDGSTPLDPGGLRLLAEGNDAARLRLRQMSSCHLAEALHRLVGHHLFEQLAEVLTGDALSILDVLGGSD